MSRTSRPGPLRCLVMILAWATLAGPVFGSTKYMRYELYQLVCSADLIVTGTIRSVHGGHWWQGLFGGSEETRAFEFDVEETVAGTPISGSLRVRCFEDWTCASRWAPYEKGQRVLLFLSRPDAEKTTWNILGGGGEGEMPLLRDSICVRGYGVRGFSRRPYSIGAESAEGSLVPLDQFEHAVQGFRETYLWELDDRRCFLAWIRPKESFAKAREYAATSLTARHLHDEAVSSRVWKGEPQDIGIRACPSSLPSLDAEINGIYAKSLLGLSGEGDALLEALHGGLEIRCAFVGDIDGDGASDLVIGIPSANFSGRQQGAAWVLFLDQDGSAKNLVRIPERRDGFPPHMDEYAKFGKGMAGVGDLDGNGVPDFVVGAPGWGEANGRRGGVWILLMAKDGSVTRAVEFGGDPLLKAAGVGLGSGLGAAIASLGDLDGDGYPELAIGEDPEFEKAYKDGRDVFIVSLGRGGTVRWVRRLHDRQDGFVTGFSSFGEGLAGPGDLDGDGIPDLVVSDSHDSDGGEYRGAVWLVSMRADGSMKDAKKISNWEGGFEGILHNGSNFGSSVCGPGDIDGDGVPDLLVGSQEGLWTLFLKRDGTVRTHSLVGNPAPDRQRASEFPICMTSTSAHDAGHPVRLMLGEVILGEKWRSETLRWAVLDSTGSLRAP